MKKYILAAMALVASVIGMRGEDTVTVYSLFVNTASGDKIEYAFEKKPVATFEGENLVITVSDAPGVEYPMSNVKNITLEGKEVSGVAEAELAADLRISVTDVLLGIKGLSANAEVRVYSISGALAASGKADEAGNIEISIDGLAKGVYVVSLPGHSFKFVK